MSQGDKLEKLQHVKPLTQEAVRHLRQNSVVTPVLQKNSQALQKNLFLIFPFQRFFSFFFRALVLAMDVDGEEEAAEEAVEEEGMF